MYDGIRLLHWNIETFYVIAKYVFTPINVLFLFSLYGLHHYSVFLSLLSHNPTDWPITMASKKSRSLQWMHFKEERRESLSCLVSGLTIWALQTQISKAPPRIWLSVSNKMEKTKHNFEQIHVSVHWIFVIYRFIKRVLLPWQNVMFS